MPAIDFEGAWYDLKAHVVSKGSHGKRELAEKMAEIELGHRLPEGQGGYDDRPLPLHERSSSEPTDEPAHAAA